MESRRRCRRRRRGAPHLAKGASLRLGARRRHQRPAPPRRDLRRSFGAHRQSSPPRLGGDTGEQGGGEEGGGEEGLTIALEAHLHRRRRRGAPFAVLKAMRRPRQRPELRRKFGAASVVSSTQRHSVRRQMRAGAAGAGGRGRSAAHGKCGCAGGSAPPAVSGAAAAVAKVSISGAASVVSSTQRHSQ